MEHLQETMALHSSKYYGCPVGVSLRKPLLAGRIVIYTVLRTLPMPRGRDWLSARWHVPHPPRETSCGMGSPCCILSEVSPAPLPNPATDPPVRPCKTVFQGHPQALGGLGVCCLRRPWVRTPPKKTSLPEWWEMPHRRPTKET